MKPPSLSLILTDQEEERRHKARQDCLNKGFTDIEFKEPSGAQYLFEAFDQSGALVCHGKLEVISNAGVVIHQIHTPSEYRRRGYASTTLWKLMRHFNLPLAAPDRRGDGTHFWEAMERKYRAHGLILGEESLAGANNLGDPKENIEVAKPRGF